MNYTELVTAIQAFTEYAEADFVTNIPNFVKSAEEQIQADAELPIYRRTQQATLTASTAYLDTPSDFISPFFMKVYDGSGAETILIEKSHDWLVEAYGGAAAGLPKYYSLFDHNSFMFGPTPDDAYVVEVTYNAKITSIVDSSTNWIGDNASNALLFGSLYYAALFMEAEEATIQRYEKLFLDARKNLMDIGDWKTKRDEFRYPNIRPKEIRQP